MALTADDIIERRRLRRKLIFWRVLGVLAFLVAVIVAGVLVVGPDRIGARSSPHVARISIDGFISDDRAELELIDRLAKNDAVKAVIVSIDSGGGATVGGESLYDALRQLSAKKPTVASIKTLGASAAYMTAIATDQIFAYRTSITGSIGVLFQSPEVSEAMAKLGIKLTEVKSSPLKAAPSPFAPASPESLQVVKSLIDDSYNWFVDIVAERRHLDRATTLKLADGRVYSGQQAKAAGLIDGIGGEDQARDWLSKEKGIDPALTVIEWKKEEPSRGFSFADVAVRVVARQLGFAPGAPDTSGIAPWLPRLNLDGLLSVWQAPEEFNAGGSAR
ncbi:signal peptide peptidase SppA [Mesorhizobium sp. BR1-1-16]|uniref:signal peptide peptidase SppA n=1 Tax=Mesorhizobium sp. BR1-1-16 TaxID=2876653 RepID=UPI001CC9CFDE|nr:signal peptide peptidase SppA [Mesorhizobium sp. BR1-1-16]MBZ9938106.1 signal peptide peptidase SppA [Mesorhizobium sp. BR1-1-16]